MTAKTENITFIPPVNDGTSKPAHGWLKIDTKIWCIRDWHSFSDFGQTLETLTIQQTDRNETKEIYSTDEGETFTFDLDYEG